MAGLEIRPAAKSDFGQWLTLWTAYNSFYGRTGPTALPDEVTRHSWTRFLDPREPVCAVVALLDDQLVGLAHYLFHPSTISIAPSCYLQDLFTAESARGRGVGRSLIDRVFEEAKIAGAGRVYWQTRESNLAARALYDRLAERSDFIVYRRSF